MHGGKDSLIFLYVCILFKASNDYRIDSYSLIFLSRLGFLKLQYERDKSKPESAFCPVVVVRVMPPLSWHLSSLRAEAMPGSFHSPQG